MSKLPTDKRMDRTALADPEVVAKILTRFMGDTVNALSDLTFRENFKSQWHSFNVIVPAIADSLILAGYRASGGSLSSAVESIVNFDTREWDTHNAVTTGATWKWIAPFSGKFLVTTAVTLSAVPMDTAIQLNLFRNGLKYRRLFLSGSPDITADATMTGAVIADMLQGDYLDVRAFQNSGGSLNYDPDDETWFQITEINTQIRDNEPVPAACWPYEFMYAYDRRPLGVIATEIRELSVNAHVGARWVDWDYTVREGRTLIRVRNIPGLTPGRAYKITLLVLVE